MLSPVDKAGCQVPGDSPPTGSVDSAFNIKLSRLMAKTAQGSHTRYVPIVLAAVGEGT